MAPETTGAGPGAEASAWLARLHRLGDEPSLDGAFGAWLARDPANGFAYGQAARVWGLLGAAGPAFRREQRAARRRAAIAACAVGVVVVAGLGAGALAQTLRRRRPSAA